MRPIIEFCVNNMHHGTEEVMKKLEANPDYDVIEYGCLGNCGECYLFPYALVNGETVAAATADELYEQILAKVKEIEAMFDLLGE
ncbi:YuzB family protein [Paenibacillus contaminans]|uniref:UDP-N-acetylmuramoylalanine--D-glutamate ligase n=1 Tax=Paenibacillus contaminans TaxID=450362 RepID=A0A329MKM2_9BACL|nr:YuzB family protein [Paenibacillus contaminans]RAV20344.1 UDP-N-acetylmuramoylalanine--D-glutamate ligase [Paenibacillus contaminans]